jgi:hypothetical protein
MDVRIYVLRDTNPMEQLLEVPVLFALQELMDPKIC